MEPTRPRNHELRVFLHRGGTRLGVPPGAAAALAGHASYPGWIARRLPIDIRCERPDDIDAIHALHAASFPTASEARLVDALREARRLVVSVLGEIEGQVIGHVAFSIAAAPDGTDCIGLAPVAVAPGYRNRGIAERLIRAGIAACVDRNDGFIVVLGDPDYYRRFGFLPASRWDLADEYGGGDAFQALELESGRIPRGGGLVTYSPQFALLESGNES